MRKQACMPPQRSGACGRARGFGFVAMPDDTAARAAIGGLPGQERDGRAFTVNEARPREDRREPRRPRWSRRRLARAVGRGGGEVAPQPSGGGCRCTRLCYSSATSLRLASVSPSM